ncbi:MAG: hypothetical protein ACJ8AO_07755, partial [Gemmatimonadaceae bacterium]
TPNLAILARRACINGIDGWGRSLRGKFAEFGSEEGEALGEQIELEEALGERAKSIETVRGALLLVAVEVTDARLALLTDEEREDVLRWAEATYRVADGAHDIEIPRRPLVLDELAITDDEAEKWLAAGPWKTSWESELGETYYVAAHQNGDDEQGAWPSEARCRLGVALLNRQEAAERAEIPAPIEEERAIATSAEPAARDANPLDLLRYECAQCQARAGEPCRSVGGKPIVEVHMARLKAAGIDGDGVSADDRSAARSAYTDRVLVQVFGYVTPELRARAKKDRSIDVTKKWVADALLERDHAQASAGA